MSLEPELKNADRWLPSKYIYRSGKLVASADPSEVGAGSRLVVNIVAGYYDSYIREYARGRLIDLGCGKAPLFQAYKPYVSDVICVDWNVSRHVSGYLDLECNLAQKLPFADEVFDTVILSDVLEHIPTPEQLLEEVFRIMSPNGKLLLNVPFYYRIHEQPHDYYRYTEFALKRFIDTAGLKIILFEAVGGIPEILVDLLSKCLCYVPVVGKLSAISIQNIASALIPLSLWQRISKKSGKVFPFGYFLIGGK